MEGIPQFPAISDLNHQHMHSKTWPRTYLQLQDLSSPPKLLNSYNYRPKLSEIIILSLLAWSYDVTLPSGVCDETTFAVGNYTSIKIYILLLNL